MDLQTHRELYEYADRLIGMCWNIAGRLWHVFGNNTATGRWQTSICIVDMGTYDSDRQCYTVFVHKYIYLYLFVYVIVNVL